MKIFSFLYLFVSIFLFSIYANIRRFSVLEFLKAASRFEIRRYETIITEIIID